MKVHALCAIGAGLDVIRFADAVTLSGIIGLAPRDSGDAISGYVDASRYARDHDIPYFGVDTYNISSTADRDKLLAQDIDILLVVGWQRLVPSWLIDHVRVGVIGIHGSANGISAGRGRSPQNWAIMLRSPTFSVSLFLVTPGIDDGPILATRTFRLEPTDEIADSYRKVAILSGRMISETLTSDPLLERRVAQPHGGLYLPQRVPDDGAIDWNRSADDVCAFVRALSRPYPGAFCETANGRLRIWKASPYRLDEFRDAAPGVVLARFSDGALLVACKQGQALLTDLEGDVGEAILPSVSFARQLGVIVARHQAKYPTLPVSPDILKLI